MNLSRLVPDVVLEAVTNMVEDRTFTVADAVGRARMAGKQDSHFIDMNYKLGTAKELSETVLFGLHCLSTEEKVMFALALLPKHTIKAVE